MTWKGRWPGTWAAICDVCGFRLPSDKLKRRWDGLMVCSQDWELRHPQDFIKIRGDKITPPWTRPQPQDNYILVCNIITSQAIPGVGIPGCLIPNYITKGNFT